MKKTKLISLAISILWISCLMYFAVGYTTLNNQSMEIQKGNKYLYSHQWEAEDPFEVIEIDTVIVLGVEGGLCKVDLLKLEYQSILIRRVKIF